MRKITDERVGRQPQSGPVVNALAVAQDYPVFPCDGLTKRPLIERGFKAATQDAAIVTRWWRQYPQALIGVPTGAASGLLAIDIDPRGKQWFELERARLGAYRLHGTRRGKHLLYRMNGSAIRNSASVVADGIDVRGEGGYVIWWPAHGGVSIGEPGELPGWLLQAVAARGIRKLNGHAHEDTPVDWVEERKRVIEALGQLDPDLHHDEWRDVLAAISNESNGTQDGENIAVAYSRGDYWSAPATTFPGEPAVRKKYRSFKNQKENNITIATLFKMVKDRDGKVPAGRPDKKASSKARIVTQLASAIGMKPIDWLWKEHLARGMLHLIAGDGGHAKSTVALSWLATITKGGAWPDGTRCEHRGQALIWSGEDATAQTIVPRLTAAHADLDKVSIITGAVEAGKRRDFDPARDLQDLRRHARSLPHLRMIIVDPIICVVDGDSNLGNEVRRSLAPLCALGEELGVMILGVHHFTKNTEGKAPLARVTGSLAFGGLARMVFAVVRDRQDEEHDSRIVVRAKSNIGPDGNGFRYRIQPVKLFNEHRELIKTTQISWREGVVGRADELLAAAEESNGQPRLEQAKAFLAHVLADGPQTYLYIGKRAQDAQITGRTLLRAKTMLKVESIKDGGRGFGWSWALPEHLDISAKTVKGGLQR